MERRPRHRRRDVDGDRGGARPVGCAGRAPARRRPGPVRDRGDPRRARSRRPRARRRASRTPRSRSWCGRWGSGCASSSSSPSTASRKRAADAIDFGDQVALAARLALDVPEVGAGERQRFRVVLLDEYQDTSYAQLTLLGALFGGGHPVTAVGDPNQSIYGWRGASAGGLEGFPTSFPQVHADGTRTPADVHQLSTSWRNDRLILAAANHVAAPLRASATRVAVPVLAARPGAGDGRVHAHVAETVEDEARGGRRSSSRDRWQPAGAGSRPGHRRGALPQAVAVRDRCAGRCGTRGCRSRSSASAVCCRRPRWSTSSPSCRPRTTRPAATPSCACSPARARGSGRRTCTRWRPGPASWRRATARRRAVARSWAGARRVRRRGRDCRRGRRGRRGRRAQHRGRARRDHGAPGRRLDEPRRSDPQRGRPCAAGGPRDDCCGRCGRTATCPCPSWSARRSGCSGSTSRSPRAHGPRRAGRARSWTRSGTSPSSSPAPPTTRTSAASSPGSRRPTRGRTASTCRSPSPIPTPCSSSPCTPPRASSGTSSRSPAWSTAVCRPRRPRARTDRRTRRG